METTQAGTDEFQLTRDELSTLWKKVKEKKTEELSGMERFYAGITQNHDAMFAKEVDGVAHPETHDYQPGQGVNPYLHILLHGLVEAQVARKAPIEIIAFTNAMKKQGLDDHAIQHLLCAVFFPLILEGRNRGGEPDMEKYSRLLKKYKTKTPEKIHTDLNREFHQTVA
ncbi:DUF1841 family protein [Desulfoluna spongiiphila]|uniref:DUF1841 family protein n=1 Tax=Desulfoluna spongiiphila TaxID=419481 RepID=UPI001251C1DE|nr:DUF1841 family protein [Desulfoluna spongiiphila]VVS94421.1 protein of unknown function duf1841 [Desulfoluna spongiiphila]